MEPTNKDSGNAPKNLQELHYSELAKLEKFQLIKIINEHLSTIKELRAAISVLKQNAEKAAKAEKRKGEIKDGIQVTRYDPEWLGLDKVIFIFKKYQRLLKTREIKSEIRQLEPNRVRAWRKNLSAVERYIHSGVKSNSLVKVHFPGKGYFYGLPEWFENGELLKEYAVNLSF